MPDAYIYRVRTVSTGWGGAPGLNTHYFLQDDSIEADHQVAALNVVTRVHAFFVAVNMLYPQTWDGQVQPVVDIINSDNAELTESLVVATPAIVPGATGYVFGPQASMICADMLTTTILDGRRVHGRGFYGPLSTVDDGDGTPTSGQLAALQGGLSNLLGGTLTDVPLVVWSRPRKPSLKHPTGLGGSAPLVSGVTVKDTFAVLRSRRQ